MALIDQILELTEQVQQFVDDGRWADASSLETKRLVLLTELFSGDGIADLSPQHAQLAHDLLTRNARMIQTLRTQRVQLNETTRRLNAAPRAVDAYCSNTPSY